MHLHSVSSALYQAFSGYAFRDFGLASSSIMCICTYTWNHYSLIHLVTSKFLMLAVEYELMYQYNDDTTCYLLGNCQQSLSGVKGQLLMS